MESNYKRSGLVENFLCKKYFFNERFICFKRPLSIKKGSTIWNPIKITTFTIHSKLTRILCNGKFISLWLDTIMGKSPLGKNLVLLPLKECMDAQNSQILYNISKRSLRHWVGQDLRDPLIHLQLLLISLSESLQERTLRTPPSTILLQTYLGTTTPIIHVHKPRASKSLNVLFHTLKEQGQLITSSPRSFP